MRVLCITGDCDRPEAETFIGLKKLGIDIMVICPLTAQYYERFIDAGIPVIDIVIKKRVDIDAIRKIRNLIKQKNINIIHMFNNRAASNGILASCMLPVKTIAYRGIEANVSFFNPASLMTYLSPRVDRVVCVAEAIRQYFLNMRFLWFRLPATKYVTIYKGHSLDWYQKDPVDLSTLGVPKDAFVVGCTVNYRPRKGIHQLIDSLSYLPKDVPIHIVLTGKMDSPRLMKQISSSRFKNQIHVLGHRKDAPQVSAAYNIVVLPSLRREGLPKGIIEAMAYGVVPVVTDSGGSPELVEHNKSGLVIPSGNVKAIADAIMRLYKDSELCRSLGQNAKARIKEDFKIENTIMQTLDLYRELLSGDKA